jgi:hypothetical protein
VADAAAAPPEVSPPTPQVSQGEGKKTNHLLVDELKQVLGHMTVACMPRPPNLNTGGLEGIIQRSNLMQQLWQIANRLEVNAASLPGQEQTPSSKVLQELKQVANELYAECTAQLPGGTGRHGGLFKMCDLTGKLGCIVNNLEETVVAAVPASSQPQPEPEPKKPQEKTTAVTITIPSGPGTLLSGWKRLDLTNVQVLDVVRFGDDKEGAFGQVITIIQPPSVEGAAAEPPNLVVRELILVDVRSSTFAIASGKPLRLVPWATVTSVISGSYFSGPANPIQVYSFPPTYGEGGPKDLKPKSYLISHRILPDGSSAPLKGEYRVSENDKFNGLLYLLSDDESLYLPKIQG